MKGTFFIKPLEFNVDIAGEIFHQGDKVEGVLKVKNHGPDEITSKELGVSLTLGDSKKIKNKSEDAYVILDSKTFDQGSFAEGELSLDFNFVLSENCPVTTKASSLFILCGELAQPHNAGALELNVGPNKWVKEFIDTMVLFYRFKVKGYKSKKDLVEYKLQAPDSKEFGAIKQLTILCKLEDENLVLNYQFKVNKLTYQAEGVKAKDEILKFDQTLGPKEYKQFGDSPNQEKMKSRLSEILDQVKRNTLI